MITKHNKPSQQNPNGGIIHKEAPIDISNVMLVCNGKSPPRRLRSQETARRSASPRLDGDVDRLRKGGLK